MTHVSNRNEVGGSISGEGCSTSGRVGSQLLPLQHRPPARPTRRSAGQQTEQRACLLSGPGGDSSSWPLARVAVAWEEAFRGLRDICWPNSCSWLLGQAGDGDGAARQALEHSPMLGRGNGGAAGELSGAKAQQD